MARPVKKGLEYFSHDVTMSDDKKIKLLEKKCGYIGYAVYLKLLEELYKNDGYFLEVDEEEMECIFSLIDVTEVFEIIDVCVQRGLFNKEKFNRYNILTSERIQKNYLAGTGRRNSVKMKNEYIIADTEYTETTTKDENDGVNVDNNSVNVDNNSVNVDSGTQTKEKKSKTKQTKQNQNEKQDVVVDVVLEAALKELEGRDDIRNKTTYAKKMIADGWEPPKDNKSEYKGLTPESVRRFEEYEKDGCLSDRQKGALARHREWLRTGI